MQGFQLIINFLVMPIFFLSGAIFPLESLPRTLSIATKFNPLSYGVDGLRRSLTGVSQIGIGFDILVLVIVSIIIAVVGSYFFSKIEI